MAVEPDDSDPSARQARRKVADFVTRIVKKTTTGWAQSAGKGVHKAGGTMASSVRSLNIIGVDQVSVTRRSASRED